MEGSSSPKRRKTENRSFRVDSEVLRGLEDEAARKRVSVNTLANQLLADYVNVGRHRLRLGTVSLTSSAFKLVIDSTSDDDIAKAGSTSGRNIPRAYASSKWGKESRDNLMQFIRDNASITGLYDYSESPSAPDTITMTHGFGRKWSIYLAAFIGAAFEDVGQRVKVDVSEQAVTFNLL